MVSSACDVNKDSNKKRLKKRLIRNCKTMSEFLPDALGIQLNAPQPQPDKYNIFIYHRWTVELFLSVSFCCVIDFKKGAYPKKFGHVFVWSHWTSVLYNRLDVFWSCFRTLSPWYNRTGWLGAKHQFTYFRTLATIVVSDSFDVNKHWT